MQPLLRFNSALFEEKCRLCIALEPQWRSFMTHLWVYFAPVTKIGGRFYIYFLLACFGMCVLTIAHSAQRMCVCILPCIWRTQCHSYTQFMGIVRVSVACRLSNLHSTVVYTHWQALLAYGCVWLFCAVARPVVVIVAKYAEDFQRPCSMIWMTNLTMNEFSIHLKYSQLFSSYYLLDVNHFIKHDLIICSNNVRKKNYLNWTEAVVTPSEHVVWVLHNIILHGGGGCARVYVCIWDK